MWYARGKYEKEVFFDLKKAVSAALAVLMSAVVALAATGCGPAKSKKTAVIPKATNAPTAPTLAPKYGRYNNTTTTSPSATEATVPSGVKAENLKAVTQKALSYYGTSEEDGSYVVIDKVETAPDGTQFYYLFVYTADGNNYPLYVAADGSNAYEPETYYAVYGISPQVEVGGDNGGYDNGGYDNGGGYDYGYDYGNDNGGYDYGGYDYGYGGYGYGN